MAGTAWIAAETSACSSKLASRPVVASLALIYEGTLSSAALAGELGGKARAAKNYPLLPAGIHPPPSHSATERMATFLDGAASLPMRMVLAISDDKMR